MRGTVATGITAAAPFAAAALFFLMKDTTLGGRSRYRTGNQALGDPEDFKMYSILSAALGVGILAGSRTAGGNWKSTMETLEGKF